MEKLNKLFIFFKNTPAFYNFFLFLAVIFTGWFCIFLLKKIYKNFSKKFLDDKTSNFFTFLNSTINNTIIPLFYLSVFYIAFNFIELPDKIFKYIKILFIISATFFILKFIVNLISFFMEFYLINKSKDTSKIKNLKGFLIIFKVFIWGLGFILILDNLGYKISTVLAGLGIGGIAVALAAQAILGDLFSYFVIIFDKPFEVDDFIIVGDASGTIETIGLKTTRIRSLSGEELIFSNSALTNSSIKNYKRMYLRRVEFKIGVTYDTPLEKLKKLPDIIKNIILSINDTKFDRAHFASYGDSALIYEIVYYVNGNDYNKYMDIQQEINLKIFEEFSKLNIIFAYPTQTIFLKQS